MKVLLLVCLVVIGLPKADPALHFCTEDARIPDVSQWSRSPSPSLVPTCPTPPQLVPHSDLAPPGVSAQNSAAAPEMDDEVHGAMEMETTPATLAYTITITFLCYPGQAPLPSRVS